MSDINEQENDVKYIWSSNGGCAVCDDMEGEYDEEPGRPHENCECIIAAVPAQKKLGKCTQDEVTYEFEGASGNADPTTHGPVSTLVDFYFVVTCKDGSTFNADIGIQLEREFLEVDLDTAFAVGLDQALDQLEAMVGDDCKECEEPLIV
jgi:hypothetical protein